MDVQQALEQLVRGADLTSAEAQSVMNQIMRGAATDAQIGAYLTALRIKGESRDEIVGSASAMRENATRVPPASTDLIYWIHAAPAATTRALSTSARQSLSSRRARA